MAKYEFEFFRGQSKPKKALEAKHDADFYGQLEDFLKKEGVALVPGSIVMTKTETRSIADPPKLKAA